MKRWDNNKRIIRCIEPAKGGKVTGGHPGDVETFLSRRNTDKNFPYRPNKCNFCMRGNFDWLNLERKRKKIEFVVSALATAFVEEGDASS